MFLPQQKIQENKLVYEHNKLPKKIKKYNVYKPRTSYKTMFMNLELSLNVEK